MENIIAELKYYWRKGNGSTPPKEYYGWINLEPLKINLVNDFKKDKTEYLCRPANNGLNLPGKNIFHIHPENDDHIFEFPSSNDLFNFAFLHNQKMLKQSIIVAAEGIYSISALSRNRFPITKKFYYQLNMIVEEAFNSDKDHHHIMNKLNKKLHQHSLYISFWKDSLELKS